MEGWRRKVLVSRSTRIDDPRRSPIDHDGVAEVPVVKARRPSCMPGVSTVDCLEDRVAGDLLPIARHPACVHSLGPVWVESDVDSSVSDLERCPLHLRVDPAVGSERPQSLALTDDPRCPCCPPHSRS